MNRALQFLGFAATISTVFFLVHLYLFSRFAYFFNIRKNGCYYAIMVFLAFSFAIATVLERNFPNPVTKVYYFFSAAWLGLLFMLLCWMAVYEIVRIVSNSPRLLTGLAIIGVSAALTIYGVLNAVSFRVSEVSIPMNVDRELTVVQISDLHLGTIRNARYLDRIVDRTNALAPDLVAVTGDLFDGTAPLRRETIAALDRVNAPVFFVTGNHEFYEGIDNVLDLLKETNVRVLRNRVERFGGIQIVGIDYSRDKSFLETTISKLELDEDAPTLLLHHVPVKAETLHRLGVDVHLAGHTHKGQIFPYMLADRLAYAYVSGLHGFEGSWIYVSAGSGTWGPPMRLGTKSEIALIRLGKPVQAPAAGAATR
jgi:predicted MPP superfamily phosphohydrolase